MITILPKKSKFKVKNTRHHKTFSIPFKIDKTIIFFNESFFEKNRNNNGKQNIDNRP